MSRPVTPLLDRLLARREYFIAGGRTHWLWTGGTVSKGYGKIREGPRGSRILLVHRASYMLFKGPIPAGFEVDHECEIILCFNPDCLRAIPGVLNNHYRNHGRETPVLPVADVDDAVRELEAMFG